MTRPVKTRVFRPITVLNVEMVLNGARRQVGRLAWRDRVIYFEYDSAFLSTRIELSPFGLKRAPGVIEGQPTVFERLHGLFNDSLPDGWGRLLMDRKLHQVGIQPNQLTPLDRLAWIGGHGMGALLYRPEHPGLTGGGEGVDLDRLADQSRMVLEDKPKAVLDELLRIGGSPQGARPKALVGVSVDGGSLIHGVDDLPDNYEHWIVKFRSSTDTADVGAIEHAYAAMAREAGVAMPPTALFPAKKGPGYFGIKRFDRSGNRRLHMHTASGLLNIDHTLPSLGYDGLLRAARSLTRRQSEVEQVFARMVFNVFAHNRDDHTKNHSFLIAEDGGWYASPAYDVTFSSGPDGEHALDIAGEGRNPGVGHIHAVANEVGVGKKEAAAIIDRVKMAVDRWPVLATGSGVSDKMASAIDRVLNGARKRKREPRLP
jgi:serine/threonine-protein kinase HipA